MASFEVSLNYMKGQTTLVIWKFFDQKGLIVMKMIFNHVDDPFSFWKFLICWKCANFLKFIICCVQLRVLIILTLVHRKITWANDLVRQISMAIILFLNYLLEFKKNYHWKSIYFILKICCSSKFNPLFVG